MDFRKLLFICTIMISSSCSAYAGNHVYKVKTLEEVSQLDLHPGDVLELESGKTYTGMLELVGIEAGENPIVIRSSGVEKAVIDGAGHLAAVLLRDCSGIFLDNLALRADGSAANTEDGAEAEGMRCGLLVKYSKPGNYSNLSFTHLDIRKVYYNDVGYVRSLEETRDGRSRSQYGWGIRFLALNPKTRLSHVIIKGCEMTDIAHTAIKIKGVNHNVRNFEISENYIYHVGGPGIQMSGVKNMHIHHNSVNHSGSVQDARNWGRGSGYWCWGAEDILVEYNSFVHAHGPQDSAGAHIDFNNNNIVYQYNFSAFNDGGFVEILGNNYNCMYRFNISVNDGSRTVGVNNAISNGGLLMLTGYIGGKGRKGPYHSYVYNNTMYVDETMQAKFMFEKTIAGVLIANNIFHVSGKVLVPKVSRYLDTIRPGNENGIFWKNNLYVHDSILPEGYQDMEAVIGNPHFSLKDLTDPTSFIPKKSSCLKGIHIEKIPLSGFQLPEEASRKLESSATLRFPLEVNSDFFGKKIKEPFMGAVRPR